MTSNLCFIGDVHSQYDKLQNAVDYAETQSLRIIFLGDLFDSRCKYSDSINVFNLVYDCIRNGHLCVNSNHQDKLIRHLKGNQVLLNNGLDITVNEFIDSNFDKNHLLEFLTSLPYGIVCKNSFGKEFRIAHAYFPNSIEIPEYDDFYFVYGNEISRKTKKNMIYGPLDQERKRVLWWENSRVDQNFIRVSGHYHKVYVDNYSVVIDSGCGSGGCLSLYNADTGCIKEF